jgi:putative endonuclease
MTYVYILESEAGRHFYTGATDDLKNRLQKHNSGDVPHTSKYRPWRLRTYIAFADPN